MAVDMSDAISIREAAAMLPGRPHQNTVDRWCKKGVRGHKLRTMRFAGRRFTKPSWVREFVAKVIQADPAQTEYDDPPETSADPDRYLHKKTKDKLAKLGREGMKA